MSPLWSQSWLKAAQDDQPNLVHVTLQLLDVEGDFSRVSTLRVSFISPVETDLHISRKGSFHTCETRLLRRAGRSSCCCQELQRCDATITHQKMEDELTGCLLPPL